MPRFLLPAPAEHCCCCLCSCCCRAPVARELEPAARRSVWCACSCCRCRCCCLVSRAAGREGGREGCNNRPPACCLLPACCVSASSSEAALQFQLQAALYSFVKYSIPCSPTDPSVPSPHPGAGPLFFFGPARNLLLAGPQTALVSGELHLQQACLFVCQLPRIPSSAIGLFGGRILSTESGPCAC